MFHPVRLAGCVIAAASLTAPALAQPGIVTSVDPGFAVTEAPLPNSGTYSGALGPHATDDNQMLFLYDNGAGITVASLDLTTLAVTDLFTDVNGTLFAFPGGVAARSATEVIVSDNGADAVYYLDDADMSGDFDVSEVSTLLSLGLDVREATGETNYTGSKVRIAKSGAITGLQAGDVLVQTADNPNPSEVIVFGDRGSGFELLPSPGAANEAYFRGAGALEMPFDGGLGFGLDMSLIVGVSLLGDARIVAVRDIDGSGQIEQATEANVLFEGSISGSGMYDLSSTSDGSVVAVSGGALYYGEVDSPDPVTSPGASIPSWTPMVETSSFFLGGGVLNTSTKPFAPGIDPATAGTLVFADFGGTELYVVRPTASSSVSDWRVLE